MASRWSGFLILIFLLAVAAFVATHEGVPDPISATAPQDLFSANRALAHLQAFATAPHPIGSPDHDRVRNYLVAQFTALGLTPQTQNATGVTPRYRVAGTVENIVARLKGTRGASDAVALAAHYDSVPAGPGAGDDGAGVAALLETLRALRAGPPLHNDLLFVVTDGEEDGLLGASAFVAENPSAKNVRVVVNFEARGNAGASQMFETSNGNGRLVQLWAQSAPHPNGSSLTYNVYKYMPNDTDMTVFKRVGDAGLNFAFIGNWEAYHTRLDNPQLLDMGSLQQHGENALALARSLGNADLAQLPEQDAIYFSLPENLFVRYSERFLWPFAIGAGVLLLGTIFYANGAWQASMWRTFASMFVHLGILLLLALIGLGFQAGVRRLHLHTLDEGPLDQNSLYVLGLFALLGSILALLYWLLRRWFAPAVFFLGGALLVYAIVLITSKWLPGGSYEFLWPLVAAILATLAAAFRPSRLTVINVITLCVLSLPALVLFVPLVRGFYEALGFTTLGAPLLGFVFGLLFLLLYPFLESALEAGGKWLPIAALLAGAALCVAAANATHYSAEHPKPSVLAYLLDADTGKALWTSSAARLDSWTEQYLGDSPTRGKLPDFYPVWYSIDFLRHETPALPLVPPQAVLLDKSGDGATRTLHFRITSPRHARTIHVGVEQADTTAVFRSMLTDWVISASVNGRDLGKPSEARWNQSGPWSFDYSNPGDGIDFVVHVQGTSQVRLVLVDRSSGLPAMPGRNPPARPADSMAIHSGDQTMVRRSFVF